MGFLGWLIRLFFLALIQKLSELAGKLIGKFWKKNVDDEHNRTNH
jgi:hypothetical protein